MSTTDLAQQVADLTTATTQLTQEVVGQKARLTAAADTATGKASEASGSASAASASATAANAAAAEAETSKNQAAEIAGLDTVEEAIDLTLAKTLGLMTETEAMAQADAYEQMFAASGMVHMGRALSNSAISVINEGMQVTGGTDTSISGKVAIGFGDSSRDQGVSESGLAVTYIAGAISNLLTGSTVNTYGIVHDLPPAEAGTRVYDSTGDVRGSGQATLDFRYDVDPKYGDVPTGTEAEILREAVGRAFEGDVKNGDARNGILSWSGTELAVTDEKFVMATPNGTNRQAYSNVMALEPNTDYVLEFYNYEITTPYPTSSAYISTTTSSGGNILTYSAGVGHHKVEFNTGSNTAVRFINYAIGNSGAGSVTFGNVRVYKKTEEVVTHRSDVATWESYDEELTGRKEIMECIQSLSTTFGDTDVPTVLSTRPLSYFQQYDGQFADPDIQNDRYRCVVWDDLTDEQKRKVAAYMGNKLYVGENGNLVNRRLRARTFRGLGNGDWRNIDVTHKGTSWDQFLSFTTSHGGVRPQGTSNSSQAYANSSGDTYATTPLQETSNDVAHKGAFAVWSKTDQAYKGRCYLYVVATVPRANQGAYTKGLNEYGAKQWKSSRGVGSSDDWDSSTANVGKTLAQCFHQYSATDPADSVGAAEWTGKIGSNSGHPDGIYYDGITAGGLNGVIDWRLPAVANDSPEEQSKVQGKVENKTFRGLEKLVRTYVEATAPSYTFTYFTPATLYKSQSLSLNFNIPTTRADYNGYKYAVLVGDNGESVVIEFDVNGVDDGIASQDASIPYSNGYCYLTNNIDNDAKIVEINDKFSGGDVIDFYLITEEELNLSVSGEFNTQMVIGDPANILQTDALKNGWLGTWCSDFTIGTSERELSRKALESSGSRLAYQYTNDNGSSWAASDAPLDGVNNSVTVALSGSNTVIFNYTAYAKVTEPCENKPVYNGKKGLMPVFVTSIYLPENGALLQESLIGKVATSSFEFQHLSLVNLGFDANKLYSGGNESKKPSHTPILMSGAPAYASMKVLPYQIAENEQCFIGYQANELSWDASSPVVITSANLGEDAVLGKKYRVEFGSGASIPAGFYVCLVAFSSRQWDSVAFATNIAGDVIDINTGIIWLKKINASGDWGDDDKIKVTADGSDTFVDLNGNTNLSVSHKTTMPTGWTKNRARIGEQVEGIDL